MNNRKGLKVNALIDKYLNSDFEFKLLKGSAISPLSILSISDDFKKLDIRKEDILFHLSDSESVSKQVVLLTDLNLYILSDSKTESVKLENIDSWLDGNKNHNIFRNLSATSKFNLTKLLLDIKNIDKIEMKDQDKTIDDYISMIEKLGKTFEDRVNQVRGKNSERENATSSEIKEEPLVSNVEKVVDAEYLVLLSEEGNKFFELIETLNADKDFIKSLHQILSISDQLTDDFRTEHVILQDLIKIFNLLDDHSGLKEKKTKFGLAYIFERLQGRDMADHLSIDRINMMVSNPKFDDNILTLKNAELIKLPQEYAAQLALPSILVRLEHDLLEKVAAHYYRFASVLAKSDGEISKTDEDILKKISGLANSPKRNLPNVKQTEVPDDETLDDVMSELNELIGLENIKKDIGDLINFLKVQKIRGEEGLSLIERSLHAVFMGPPGTGKTTIARMLSRIYKHLGYLEKGHLVETDRAGLVAGYVGQTALKVDEVVKVALDGVLFVDEAYALSQGENKRDFGNEAVEALLKRMEDHRDDLVVIAAGYPDEMKSFIQSNPGLQSRFNRFFNFDHYNGEELVKIFKLFAGKADFELSEEAEEKLSFIFDELYEKRNPQFGNARVARNIFEQCISRQANRIVSITPLTKEILIRLEEPDIPPVKETVAKVLVFAENKE